MRKHTHTQLRYTCYIEKYRWLRRIHNGTKAPNWHRRSTLRLFIFHNCTPATIYLKIFPIYTSFACICVKLCVSRLVDGHICLCLCACIGMLSLVETVVFLTEWVDSARFCLYHISRILLCAFLRIVLGKRVDEKHMYKLVGVSVCVAYGCKNERASERSFKINKRIYVWTRYAYDHI